MKQMCTRVLTTLCLGFIVACGGVAATPNAGDSGAPADPSEQCPADTETFRDGPMGLLRSDDKNNLSVRIVHAEAVPPTRDFNDWTIAVTDASGAPLPNAQLTWACAWMPVHGHGSNPKRVNKLDGGRFDLLQQNLSMFGGWQIKLWIDPDGGSVDFQPKITSGDVCMPNNGTSGPPNIEFDVCVPRMRGG
jgi:hypothetical protein